MIGSVDFGFISKASWHHYNDRTSRDGRWWYKCNKGEEKRAGRRSRSREGGQRDEVGVSMAKITGGHQSQSQRCRAMCKCGLAGGTGKAAPSVVCPVAQCVASRLQVARSTSISVSVSVWFLLKQQGSLLSRALVGK